MSDFSYTPPDEGKFFKGVLQLLQKRNLVDYIKILRNAKCEFDISSSFSHVRWNGMYTTVVFRLPINDFEHLNLEDQGFKTPLIQICSDLMPPNAGLDVLNVEFCPSLESIEGNDSLHDDLDEIVNNLTEQSSNFSLPDDVMVKGQQMAEVYLYLYVVEKYLRLFIEKVLTEKFGLTYFANIVVPKSILNGIVVRKEQEKKNLWIGVRGNSDLFYFDFKDLGVLIQNNWDIFKIYFPDQAWVSSKIDEMGNCRNLVAHNSVIGEHERDVIRINFRSITKQLNSYMKKP
jgi:hypothetical protein